MAKQVSEILVKLGIQGLEGLDKLKSSFRDLEKAIGPSNSTIEKARRSIIEFGDASGRTEQIIRGQLEAFRGLRSQAEIGGETYNKLTTSIRALEIELRGSTEAIDRQRDAVIRSTAAAQGNATALQQQISALTKLQQQTRPGSSAFAQLGKDIDSVKSKLTGVRSEAQSFALALNQIPAASLDKQARQIEALRRGMAGLTITSNDYLTALQRIALISNIQSSTVGRQQVLANFQMFASEQFGTFGQRGQKIDLPNTTAALEQQLSELTVELNNVERGSARYVDVSNRMAEIQRQLRTEITGTAEAFRKLDLAQAGVERRAEKLSGIQEYYRTQGPMAPGAGGFRDPVTGAIIARGARTPGRIRVDEAAYQTPIGPQPFPEAGRRAQESIQRAMDDVNRIYEDARIRRVEIQSKYDQIHIDKLLEGLELEGRVRDKGFRDELAAFDRQLEARDRKRRRRITAGQAVQAAGAVISGGIFGGPEGLAGGAVGAAIGSAIPGLGTVGGAFAGAAIGAQVGMVRQQAGAIGEYVAQLNLAKTTLAQAASNQDEYNKLLQLARSVSSDYAVALRPSIEGLAQIATAAQANNLTFKETEAIYRGVIASGVAFGKSQQDLDALIRATTQVLSKGKVSAEEMSGQIGERLPGAVAKFAAATGRTLPELAKAFERGEVTIADFVKFASDQFEEYDDVAQLIAEGPEKAGVRLQIALDTAAENFGGFFQRTGSGLQQFLTDMIDWVNQNSAQIKQYVTDWVNAGAAIFNVLSQIAGAFGRLTQRFYQFMQANPGVALGNAIRRGIFGVMGGGQGQFTPEQLFPEFKPPQFGGGGTVDLTGGGAVEDSAKAKSAADKAARQAQRAYEENLRNALRLQDAGLRMLEIEEMTTLERQRQQLVRQDADAIEFAILDLKQKQLGIDIKQTAINEANERLDDLRVQGLNAGLDVSKTAEEIAKNQIEYKQLQLEREKAVTEEMRLQLEILEAMGLTKELRQAGRRAGLGVFEFGGGGQPFGTGGEQLYQSEAFMTPQAERFQEMRQQLEELISLENQVGVGAIAMGEAFSSAFIETISGSKSARQALADLMGAIGKHFLEMAQQIIAQQLAMIVYGTIMRALGIGLSGGGAAPNYSGIFGGGQAGFNPSVFTGPSLLPAANGAAFAQNGIQPFANGGIVTKPTFFKYADGGTFSNGVMGEAGPEAIMPLKRGADGKLGVAAKLDGAMSRYRRPPGAAGAAEAGSMESTAATSAAAAAPIDVRYTVERINSVDYVTADQFQRGMAQAAEQGARQGERRALYSLRQNTNVRKSIGV